MNHAEALQPEDPKKQPDNQIRDKISEPPMLPRRPGDEDYGTGSEFYRFGREVKQRFLEIAPKLWPNVGKMCRAVGIDRQTYYNHMKADHVFRAAMEEIRESRLDDLEEVNVREGNGTGKEAFLPRISTLKAYRKAIYDPAKVVRVEGLAMGADDKTKRFGVVDTVIDAEVAKTYLDRKQIKEANQQKKLADGKGIGGEKDGGQGGRP